jgi:putative endopeptidase
LVKNVDLAGYLNQVGVKTDRVILGELGYFKNYGKKEKR